MATEAREKRPAELIQLGVDFDARLLLNETIIVGNISVTIVNALTDVDATSTIKVASSEGLSGDIITARFQAGSHNDIYEITFSTGACSTGNEYQKKILLKVTNTPKSDSLLANRDELKRKLDIPDTDTSDDQFLDELLLAASDYIRNRCARDFELHTYVETRTIRRNADTKWLQLREWPVRIIDQIELILYDDTVQVTITDQTSYKWHWKEEGELFFSDGTLFYRYPDYNRITYRAGYDLIPHDIRECCKELASWLYQAGQAGGLARERLGDYSYTKKTLRDFPVTMKAELPVEYVESTIKRFKRYDISEAE